MSDLKIDLTGSLSTYLSEDSSQYEVHSGPVHENDLKKGDLVTTYNGKIGLVVGHFLSTLSFEPSYEILIGDEKRIYPRLSLKKIKKKLDTPK